MFYELSQKILYSDTLVPDIFIAEYFPQLTGDCLKVYIYCLFLNKHSKKASYEDIAARLNMKLDDVKNCFNVLESKQLMNKTNKGFAINDIKDIEISRIYKLKTTSSPDEALQNVELNSAIQSINTTFFNGTMSPSMYTDIDNWYKRYKFDLDVMISLFQYCHDRGGLHRNYIEKVADDWHKRSIKNSFELEQYFEECKRIKDINNKIRRKLRLPNPLSEYEEEYVKKWTLDFKYDFDIIEIALKRTVYKPNVGIGYFDTIISEWFNKGLRSKEQILEFEGAKKQPNANKKTTKEVPPNQLTNFKQRQYDKDYLNKLYENV